MAKKNIYLGDWAKVYNPNPNQRDPRYCLEDLDRAIMPRDTMSPGNMPMTGFQVDMPRDPQVYAQMRVKVEVE